MIRKIKRGDIFYISGLPYIDGHVEGGERPAIIVSNNAANRFSEVIEVVFLTTAKKKPLQTHVKVMAFEMSTALCEQVNSISKQRIDRYIKTCTEREMQAIDKALMISLGLEKEGDDSCI